MSYTVTEFQRMYEQASTKAGLPLPSNEFINEAYSDYKEVAGILGETTHVYFKPNDQGILDVSFSKFGRSMPS